MASLKGAAQQRSLLILGFTLLFSVSLAVILFERVKQQEQAGLSLAPASVLSVVRGDVVIRDETIALYHGQARQVAVLLFSNIDQLSQGQAVNKDELAAARQTIITIKVPGIYQELHFKLLRILNKLEDSAATDLDYLLEQRRLLQEEFAWL